jgi:hypothetical protein
VLSANPIRTVSKVIMLSRLPVLFYEDSHTHWIGILIARLGVFNLAENSII